LASCIFSPLGFFSSMTIPLYMKADTIEEREYVSYVLTMAYTVSIAMFTVYFVAISMI
jgi:hypothetical protein